MLALHFVKGPGGVSYKPQPESKLEKGQDWVATAPTKVLFIGVNVFFVVDANLRAQAVLDNETEREREKGRK